MSGSHEEHPHVAAIEEETGDGQVLVVSVEGELDLAVSEELSASLERAGFRDYDGHGVVLDLGGVTFMDSSGVQAVLVATEALRGAGRPYAVVVPEDSPINAILELTQVAERLPLYRDAPSARDALGGSR